MEPAAKNGDSMQKTRADCIANLKILYPDIKSGDMATIVNSIFKLLQVTDRNEAQHTKKRPPRKRSEQQKENKHLKNEREKKERLQKKAERERLQKEEDARHGKPTEESPLEDEEARSPSAGNEPDYTIFHEKAKRSREARARVAARMQLIRA